MSQGDGYEECFRSASKYVICGSPFSLSKVGKVNDGTVALIDTDEIKRTVTKQKMQNGIISEKRTAGGK